MIHVLKTNANIFIVKSLKGNNEKRPNFRHFSKKFRRYFRTQTTVGVLAALWKGVAQTARQWLKHAATQRPKFRKESFDKKMLAHLQDKQWPSVRSISWMSSDHTSSSSSWRNSWSGLPDGTYIFKPKILMWVNFLGPWNREGWYILGPIGTYYSYFVVLWPFVNF
jgi:uncharacterized protein (DUF736 family)